MFYDNNRQDTRNIFFLSWKKYRQKMPLIALEQQVVDVILMHPEYHDLLEKPPSNETYFPELGQTNPFLHMGLHLALRDQVRTNRPPGIRDVFNSLCTKFDDLHSVEHILIEPLAEFLWLAQKNKTIPNETNNLVSCQQILAQQQ